MEQTEIIGDHILSEGREQTVQTATATN